MQVHYEKTCLRRHGHGNFSLIVEDGEGMFGKSKPIHCIISFIAAMQHVEMIICRFSFRSMAALWVEEYSDGLPNHIMGLPSFDRYQRIGYDLCQI